jgi:hypothetical protein
MIRIKIFKKKSTNKSQNNLFRNQNTQKINLKIFWLNSKMKWLKIFKMKIKSWKNKVKYINNWFLICKPIKNLKMIVYSRWKINKMIFDKILLIF